MMHYAEYQGHLVLMIVAEDRLIKKLRIVDAISAQPLLYTPSAEISFFTSVPLYAFCPFPP
jgi:hypothetical protein